MINYNDAPITINRWLPSGVLEIISRWPSNDVTITVRELRELK